MRDISELSFSPWISWLLPPPRILTRSSSRASTAYNREYLLSSPLVPFRTLGAPTLAPPTPVIESTDASSATVSWSAATAAEIDSPITSYVVVYKTVDCRDGESTPRERWERGEVPAVPDAMSCHVKGLRHDTQYQFAIRAVNAVGAGPAGEYCDPQWTKGPPTIAMVRRWCHTVVVPCRTRSWAGC